VVDTLGRKRYQNGSIIQSKDGWNYDDYKDYRMNAPVLGVVLAIYPSDHPTNISARDRADQRGYYWAADVRILNDGLEGTNVIPNVTIPPNGASGVDNFSQDLPKPTSCMLDGSRLTSSMSNVDADNLDGDRCLIQFIGGKYNNAVMTHWMPHPANRQDPSTGGHTFGSIDQGSPTLLRRQGTTLAVSDEGSIFIDTNGANSTIVGKSSGYERVRGDIGGDVQIDVKASSKFEINFNTPVEGENEPSLLQTNPPVGEISPEERLDSQTRVYLDKDSILAIAGEVIRLQSNNNDIYVMPGPESSIYLGDGTSEENMVLGQLWKTMMNSLMETVKTLMDTVLSHTHPTGTGPSGTALPPAPTDIPQMVSDVQTLIDDIDTVLSDYVFASKEVPVIDEDERETETGEDA
jgi:hypothetical protein